MEKIITGIISRVNSSLCHFQKDCSSVKRYPDSEKERCSTLEQYVEIRFNFECWKEPLLSELIVATDGKLFKCVRLDDVDLSKRRFSLAHFEINKDVILLSRGGENLKDELDNLPTLLGGSIFKFNNVRKKIKLSIE